MDETVVEQTWATFIYCLFFGLRLPTASPSSSAVSPGKLIGCWSLLLRDAPMHTSDHSARFQKKFPTTLSLSQVCML